MLFGNRTLGFAENLSSRWASAYFCAPSLCVVGDGDTDGALREGGVELGTDLGRLLDGRHGGLT